MGARSLFELRPARAAVVTLLLLVLAPLAAAQGGWEMRVCAAPFDYPMSSRDDVGFNNEIAEIVADELGAVVTYEWVRLDPQNVRRTLLSGECDVIVGIAEGASNVLSTVPYLRIPYVFVSREEADIEIESINDPILRELRIGTYQQGIPEHVLDSLGVTENVIGYPPVGTPGGSNLDLAALEAVAEGEVDVAILYAPRAVAYDAANPVDFRIQPVTPEVIPAESLIVMSRTWTIGVRPGDEAFRDRLNIALAERWEDVQAAVAEYGIPQIDIQPPVAGDGTREPGTSIGVIVPGRTGGMVELELLGEDARRGALLAEVVQSRGSAAETIHILHANAPTDPAAVRAAERLIETEGVAALAGGFGYDQAVSLSKIAEEAKVLFFNVASTATDLRQQCAAFTFHVEASDAMLADAAIAWYGDEEGVESWFLVHENSTSGEALLEHVQWTLEESESGELVGNVATPPDQFLYMVAVESAVASGAQAVLLALAPRDQELFLSQYPQGEDSPPVVLIPSTEAQTRDFLRRFVDVATDAGVGRPATWDPTLSGDGADLNEIFLSRHAAPMDPVAWTTYAAVMIFHQAVSESEERTAPSLARYLTAPEASFELGKGFGLSFRQWSHQLRQPIYLIRHVPEAEWGIEPQRQVEFGEIVGQRPELQESASLDALGIAQQSSACGDGS